MTLVNEARLHSGHASTVVTNMLEFTKLRAGKLVLPTDRPLDVLPLCNSCRSLVHHLTRPKLLELRVDCDEISSVLGSPFHVQQVLLNLLTA